MKNILFPSFLLLSILGSSQTFNQSYKDRAVKVTQTNINSLLTNFSNLGIKTTGSTANNNALAWLKNQYISYGYTASQITENTFNYTSKPTTNLIVTKVGTKYPTKFIIICGHYDTVNGPGVNDNGSGISIILEAARILQNVDSEYSLKFINFTGEEQGLFGSQNYVTTVVNATSPKMDIKLVINIDEVGGVAGMTNDQIYAEKDVTPNAQYPSSAGYPSTNNAASATATNELINCMSLYSKINAVMANAERSDYMPFDKNNDVITGLYEFNQSSKPHSANDTYANMDPVYVYNIAQGVVGGIQHFSVAKVGAVLGAVESVKSLDERVSLFPNPATNFINIGIDGKGYTTNVFDTSGKMVLSSQDEQSLNTSKLSNGVYLLKVSLDGQSVTKKFIIKK